MVMVQSKPVQILLVEDNQGDTTLINEALNELKINVNLSIVKDGVEAMDYLHKSGSFSKAMTPNLIILDLNLPRKNGIEVMSEIKREDALKDIPIVVFTTSQSQKDILKTYGLGGAFFITKPLGFHEYMRSIKSIISTLVSGTESDLQ